MVLSVIISGMEAKHYAEAVALDLKWLYEMEKEITKKKTKLSDSRNDNVFCEGSF